MSDTLVEIRDLKKHFPVMKGVIFQKPIGWVKAVDGVSYSISTGETLGLVGESGCGKTTTSKLLLMLEKPTSGAIIFRGHDIQTLEKDELKTYRRGVQAVFQDPFSSLNPRIRVGDICARSRSVYHVLRRGCSRGALRMTLLARGQRKQRPPLQLILEGRMPESARPDPWKPRGSDPPRRPDSS